MPDVSLRARTDDDLDVLYRLTADLDTWEERNPAEPAPMTRARFDALLARSAAAGWAPRRCASSSSSRSSAAT